VGSEPQSKKYTLKPIFLLALVSLMCATANAEEAGSITVPMHLVSASGVEKSIGTIEIHPSKSSKGLVFTPDLAGLKPGSHGFHIHENPSCEPGMKAGVKTAAVAAGGHYDPEGKQSHKAPWENGHKGDLPVLIVTSDGMARTPVFAPRLELDDIDGRAVMIHEGGDTYSDSPEKLGGGGARQACGVIRQS